MTTSIKAIQLATKHDPSKKISPEEREKMKKRDHKMVKGTFRCFEPRGGSYTFPYRKWEGEQVCQYTMLDGEVYEVPRMVANHLNDDCWYPVHAHTLDANGSPHVQIGKKVQRCSFESLEFMTGE